MTPITTYSLIDENPTRDESPCDGYEEETHGEDGDDSTPSPVLLTVEPTIGPHHAHGPREEEGEDGVEEVRGNAKLNGSKGRTEEQLNYHYGSNLRCIS